MTQLRRPMPTFRKGTPPPANLELGTYEGGPLGLPEEHQRVRQARASHSQVHVGRVTVNHRGFAFVLTEAGQSYYLRAQAAKPFLTGDEIHFTATGNPAENDADVAYISFFKREETILLCEVVFFESGLRLVPDEPFSARLNFDPTIFPVEPGDVVAVRVPAAEGRPALRGIPVTITKNLGKRTREGFDIEYALVRYGFDKVIPESAQAEASQWESQVQASPNRAETPDLFLHDGIPFVTIDGEHSRDFDDAVFAQRTEDGWEVRIAIADVSWYVREGSELDQWAASRGTSLYLPGKTVPMLPEVLSTDRCSLNQDEWKRAVVVTIHVGADGKVKESSLSRSIIKSAARLTYNQVAAFMAGKNIRFAAAVERNLQDMTSLYEVLAAVRSEAGRLEFEDPEPSLVQGEDGSWQLVWEVRNDAHKLVEELMLLANRTAADMLIRRYGAGLFRHQPPPTQSDWDELKQWAATADHTLPEVPNLRALSTLAAAFTGNEQSEASLRIRSAMQPARYVVAHGEVNSGHFSLDASWYTHFTSPIRRYADLLVHRLLLAPSDYKPTTTEWEALAGQVAICSERSQAARMAERQMWDTIKLRSFLTDVPANTPVRARVVRTSQRGLRVVIQGRLCSAWLSSDKLLARGYSFNEDLWVAPTESEQEIIKDGTLLTVAWTSVNRTRPAYPELQVDLMSEG